MRIRRFFDWLRARLTPLPKPGPDNAEYISDLEAIEIIDKREGIKPRLLHLPDREFYCPSWQYTQRIIADNAVNTMRYTAERFDCDDFAWLLKSAFVEDAYRNGERRAAHCFGVAHGLFPLPHAINWVITDDQRLRFIEPQTDKEIPRSQIKEVWVMLA